jgi:DNA-binding SARP family transcriptional activator
MDRLVTRTLAEIYLQQGHFEEAYSLFKALSERDPEDVELRNRLKELEEKMNPLVPPVETGEALQEYSGNVDRSISPPTYLAKAGQEHPADLPATLSQSTQSTPPAPKRIQNLEKWLNNIRERRKP